MRARLTGFLLPLLLWAAPAGAQGMGFTEQDLINYRNEQFLRARWHETPDRPPSAPRGVKSGITKAPSIRALSEDPVLRLSKGIGVIEHNADTINWVRKNRAFFRALGEKAALLPKGTRDYYDVAIFRGKVLGFNIPGQPILAGNVPALEIRRVPVAGTNVAMAKALGFSCFNSGLVCVPPEGREQTAATLPKVIGRITEGIYIRDIRGTRLMDTRFPMLESRLDRDDRPIRRDDIDLGIFEHSFDHWYEREPREPVREIEADARYHGPA